MKRMFLTILRGKRVHGFLSIRTIHSVLLVSPSAPQLIRPMNCCWMRVILGPYVVGKAVLILQESLGCDKLQSAACLRWNNGSHATAIRHLALATRDVTTPLTLEYPNDASGGLYAAQICAQRLPRELRLLIYGSTHKGSRLDRCPL